MRSLNKVQLIGNIGCQPQTHVFPDGNMVTNFTMATNHNLSSKQRKDRENQENQENEGNQGKAIDQKNQKGKFLQKKTYDEWGEEETGKEADQRKQKQPADWHNITCYGKLAEIAAAYLQVGHKAFVEGYLRHRTFEDKEGQKHYITEIVAKEIIHLTPKLVQMA